MCFIHERPFNNLFGAEFTNCVAVDRVRGIVLNEIIFNPKTTTLKLNRTTRGNLKTKVSASVTFETLPKAQVIGEEQFIPQIISAGDFEASSTEILKL